MNGDSPISHAYEPNAVKMRSEGGSVAATDTDSAAKTRGRAVNKGCMALLLRNCGGDGDISSR